MTMRHLSFVLVFCSCWLACGAPRLLAERSKYGLSPEDQKRHDELLRSAEKGKSIGVLAAQVGVISLGVTLLCVAYTTATRGLKITREKTLQGPAAKVLALILAALAVGIAVGGFLYLPSLVG